MLGGIMMLHPHGQALSSPKGRREGLVSRPKGAPKNPGRENVFYSPSSNWLKGPTRGSKNFAQTSVQGGLCCMGHREGSEALVLPVILDKINIFGKNVHCPQRTSIWTRRVHNFQPKAVFGSAELTMNSAVQNFSPQNSLCFFSPQC